MKRANLFIILTILISWIFAAVLYFSELELKSVEGTIALVAYMFIPMLVTLLITKLIYKEKIVQNLKISFDINKWFLVAWLIMPILAGLTMLISLLFPEVTFSPGMEGMFERYESLLSANQQAEMKSQINELPIHPIWLIIMQAMIAGISINAIAGFGEELGWRGLLLKEYSRLKFIKASLFIGIIWGIWHAPIILLGHNYPDHPVIGVAMMILWCILLSPLFVYISIKSKSVIAASVLHGSLNSSSGLAIILIAGGSDLIVGLTGLSGFTALIFLLIAFFIYDQIISKEKISSGKINDNLFYEKKEL